MLCTPAVENIDGVSDNQAMSVSKPANLGRGSRTVRLRMMVTGGGGHNVYPGSGPLEGGNTLLPS